MRNILKNRKYRSVKDKLEVIQKSKNEPLLFEPLRQLFIAKGYNDVDITHGPHEHGKDLVFSFKDILSNNNQWCAVIVKNKNASQSDFLPGGELGKQIASAFSVPYKRTDGSEAKISRVWVIVNGTVSPQAREVASREFERLSTSIIIEDYQKLTEHIEEFIEDLFLDDLEPAIHKFAQRQIIKLGDVSSSNQLFNLELNDIEDIFVDVQIQQNKIDRDKSQYIGESSNHKQTNIDGAIDILNTRENFIVHGIPASGKSILLKRTGIKALRNLSTNYAVFLIDFSKQRKDKPNSVKDITRIIEKQYVENTDNEIFEKASYERILVMFDGIDDVHSEDDVSSIVRLINDFSTQFKDYQIVMALRTSHFLVNEDILSKFENIELMPFNLHQALTLVQKIIPNDKRKAQSFTNALKNSMISSSLFRTPLALTLLAILYRDGMELEELPANITELYKKFIDIYLERWDTTKGISQQHKFERVKDILAYIAFRMHQNMEDCIDVKTLEEYLFDLKAIYSHEELENIPNFIKFLISRRGVYVYHKSHEVFCFYNNDFQQYFLSLHFDESNESKLVENFLNEQYENAIVFYCGANPKREVFLDLLLNKVIAQNVKESYSYINLLSKSLQASHNITKEKRKLIVKDLLFNYDLFYRQVMTLGAEGRNFLANSETIDIILAFRDLFKRLFNSKHIYRPEIESLFDDILLQNLDLELSDMTIYSIAHLHASMSKSSIPLELFASEDKDPDTLSYDYEISDLWARIIYTDIKMLHFKISNDDLYKRLKRKSRKRNVYIASQLHGLGTDILKY
ncbi:hypothetical protein [Nonlabens dokdonensis]|uniref:NACHT domain-containing protein n=1 Tax=Nonlabens dokdonensis TaxID=328515 RepID=UPI0026EF51BC|nr:hypothetical protein [Nonlabens dokdonensis]